MNVNVDLPTANLSRNFFRFCKKFHSTFDVKTICYLPLTIFCDYMRDKVNDSSRRNIDKVKMNVGIKKITIPTRKNTEKHNICIETKFVLEQNVVN